MWYRGGCHPGVANSLEATGVVFWASDDVDGVEGQYRAARHTVYGNGRMIYS